MKMKRSETLKEGGGERGGKRRQPLGLSLDGCQVACCYAFMMPFGRHLFETVTSQNYK